MGLSRPGGCRSRSGRASRPSGRPGGGSPPRPGTWLASPRTRAFGPSGPTRIDPSASLATSSSPTRSSTGPSRPADIAVRPARDRLQHRRRLVGLGLHPGGRRARRRIVTLAGASRCRRPGSPPDARPATSPAAWSTGCRASSSARPRAAAAGASSAQHPARAARRRDGSPTAGRPPARCASSQSSGGSRKSIQPMSPNALAWPGLGGHLLAGHQHDAVRRRGRGQLARDG